MFTTKQSKFFYGLLFDAIGMLSYLGGPFGVLSDVIWAPLSLYLMTRMYAGNAGIAAGIVSAIEELSPGLDIIPTFTITWFYVHVLFPEKSADQLKINS